MTIIADNNTRQIGIIQNFATLAANWDSYNANKPSLIAITKATAFAQYLSDKDLDIFFTAPTPDGDILVELKNKKANLEFIFSAEVEDKIIASYADDFVSETILNDITLIHYLKWLTCENYNCPD